MSAEIHRKVLNMFNCMVTSEGRRLGEPTLVDTLCVAVNFAPTQDQLDVLREEFSPLPITTLFTVSERKNSDPVDLIMTQLLHYVEVYGLGMPGVFNLGVKNGQVLSMNYVCGVSVFEIEQMVLDVLYSNAPIKNTQDLIDIVSYYNISFDLIKVKNNEARILLYENLGGVFDNGDDVVRYLCYLATGESILIKDRNTIESIKSYMLLGSPHVLKLFNDHVNVLSHVFNRHKKLILAAKNKHTANVINKIARLSKKNHVPVREHISKRFINEALNGKAEEDALKHVSVRDKLKYLNVLANKLSVSPENDVFIIRNGKLFVTDDRPVFNPKDVNRVTSMVLESLKEDLGHLNGQRILLDKNVDYGLPTSRKQTMGHLPFNTRVQADTKNICAGIYWENAWGANDLDLSTIDMHGNRTGWGMYSGYDNKNPITFSGDLTDARNGAMEFMTSKGSTYGLFVNIYNGKIGCAMEIVVGNKRKSNSGKWIDDTIIREKVELQSRGMVIGNVHNNEFIVYSGRLSNASTSSNVTASSVFAEKALLDTWTVSTVFDALNITYDLDKEDDIEYNYDLSYKALSYDKLEALFGI